MPEQIRLDSTEDSPKVILDAKNDLLEVSGRSLPEDALSFYAPLLEWLREYIKDANPYTEFIVKLDYFNSASSKQIVDMMILLEEANALPDKEVVVNWGYEKDDDIMKIRGQEMESIIELPFKYHEY